MSGATASHADMRKTIWCAGSGKTAAFLIPILERLKEHSTRVGARAVVLSPTRELAMQTAKFLGAMSKFTTLRYTLLVGGDSMELQVRRARSLSCTKAAAVGE